MHSLMLKVFISFTQVFYVFSEICPNSRYCHLTQWNGWNCTGCVTGTSQAVRKRGVCCSSPFLDICLIGCKMNKTDVEQMGQCDMYCKASTLSPASSLMASTGALTISSASGSVKCSTGITSRLSRQTSNASASIVTRPLQKLDSTGITSSLTRQTANASTSIPSRPLYNSGSIKSSTDITSRLSRQTSITSASIVSRPLYNSGSINSSTGITSSLTRQTSITSASILTRHLYKAPSTVGLSSTQAIKPSNRLYNSATATITGSPTSIQKGGSGVRNGTSTTSPSITSEDRVCLEHCKMSTEWESCMADCLSVPCPSWLCRVIWFSIFVLGLVVGGIVMVAVLACLKRRKHNKKRVLPIKKRPIHQDFQYRASDQTVKDDLIQRGLFVPPLKSKNSPRTDTTCQPNSTKIRAFLEEVD